MPSQSFWTVHAATDCALHGHEAVAARQPQGDASRPERWIQARIRRPLANRDLMKLTRILIAAALVAGCGSAPNTRGGSAGQASLAPLLSGLEVERPAIRVRSIEAQRFFDQGLTLKFASDAPEAARSFREAARLAPDCAMAFWGEALVLGPSLDVRTRPDEVAARAALERAVALTERASERERGLIGALVKRHDPRPGADRAPPDAAAYAEAMGELARRYPDDADIRTLFAEALMLRHPREYWDPYGEAEPWTAEILTELEAILARWPDHPGANWLHIVALEASPDPGRALPAAGRLQRLVPGSGSFLHLPAHVYMRVGRYHDASLALQHAIRVDGDYLSQCRAQEVRALPRPVHHPHMLSVSAAFAGRRGLALQAARSAAREADPSVSGDGAFQHLSVTPLFTLVRFGQWSQILQEREPEEGLSYARGIWHFARGLALAGLNRPQDAEVELAKVRELASDRKLERLLLWDIHTAAELIRIASNVLAGELAAREGAYEKALAHLTEAVALEGRLTYDIPPAWVVPVRHNLGAVLLEAGRAEEAVVVYQEDLVRHPDNGWALFGLQKSLEATADRIGAEQAAKALARVWREADIDLVASRF